MRRSLSVLGGLALGLALGQFPEYAQQYTQRLGGAVDELRAVVEDFDAGARAFGLNRDEAIARYSTSSDPFLASRGQGMSRTIARYDQLSATLAEIRTADPWTRFTLLPRYFDTDIGRRALQDFKPAMPATTEGFLYGAFGYFVGYWTVSALVRFVALPWTRGRRNWRRRRKEARATAPDPAPGLDRFEPRVRQVLAPKPERIEPVVQHDPVPFAQPALEPPPLARHDAVVAPEDARREI